MAGNAKRLVIVGNGPLQPGAREGIDSADAVIRFNHPPHSPEVAGTRTDILFVANAGKPMQRRLEERSYPGSPFFMQAQQVILPYDPEIIRRYHPKPNLLSRLKGRRADWTRQTKTLFERAGKPVKVLSARFYIECCEMLDIEEADRRQRFPSTGFIALRYGLEAFPKPEWSIEFHGFTWEGWNKHAWDAEREWIARHLAL